MKKTISVIFALILSIGLLTACAGGSKEANSAGGGSTAAAGEESQTANEEETASWPRTIVDAGENEITLSEQPQRIAILHSNYLEYFFALDVPPIASAGASVGTAQQALDTYETLEPYRGTAEIMDLGSAREINLEAILEAWPDVIVTFLGHKGLDEIYDQLTQIAPVVLLDFNDTWQNQIRACAEIVGKEELAKENIQKTESSISAAYEVIAKQEKTVALFRTNGGQAFVGRGNEDYYSTFGIKAPEGYTYDYATFSLEAVAEMNPDYIILQDYIDISKGFVKSQEESSVWKNMNAVKNGNILYFDDSLNTFGPLAMRLTAEKLEQSIK